MTPKIEIERLLYITDDSTIARYLNVPASRVAKVRATAPKQRIRSHRPQQGKSETITSKDLTNSLAEIASEKLLRRQLATGQCHWDRPTARAIMQAKGWA